MKKKIGLFVLLLAVVGLLTGCLKKTAITAEDFKKTMSEKEYSIVDANDQFDSDKIKQVYLAVDKNNEYQIEFYEFTDESSGKTFFNNNKKKFEDSITSSKSEISVDMGSYQKYELEADNRYKLVSKIENTAIYVDVDEKYEKDVKEMIKKLGY